MKPVHWRPLARRDVDDAAKWYASQGGLALELAFIKVLEAAINQIARHPAIGSTRHAVLFPDLPTPMRFLVLKKFDRYLIFYLEFPSHVEIIRVWDAARDMQAIAED